MKKLTLVLLVLMLSVVTVFAGGGSQRQSSGSGTTLRWAYWGSGDRVTRSQAAIDAYQAATPGIVVNQEVSGSTNDHFTKVSTQIAGGNGPDIILFGGNYGADGVDKGILLPLDQYVGPGKAIDTSTLDPGTIELGTWTDGHVYGISVGTVMAAMAYNKTLLEKYGCALPNTNMSWEEFRAYLVSIKAKLPAGVYPLQDFGVTSSGTTGFGYWTRWNNTPLYDITTDSSPVTPAVAAKFLDLFKDYRDNGLIPPADIAGSYAETGADSSSLVAGKVAIGFLMTSQFAGFQDGTTDELNLIEMPGASTTNKALWPQMSAVYTINKDSKNIDAAVKFINFLINSPDAGRTMATTRGISSSSSYRSGITPNMVSATDKKILAYFDAAAPHSSPETPHLPGDTEFNSTMPLIYQQVAFGRLTTAAAGQQVADLLKQLIAKW
ncbi:sugar ABC transporter substrate-binding protein [Spirochaetia bacterium]|nr:sugar ABC transporter substrate-binding protein [Spirochaetia bacterium]